MTLAGIDEIIGFLQHVFRSKEEGALLEVASAADEMLEDIKSRPSVVKFWAALQAVSAIEAAKAPASSQLIHGDTVDPPSSVQPTQSPQQFNQWQADHPNG